VNIIFDHQIFYTQRFGGISRYFFELSEGLVRQPDLNVSVVAPFHVNEYLRYGNRLLVKGPYFGGQFRSAGRIRRWGRKLLLPMQYALKKNADIVHETYYSMNPTGNGRFRILTVYDMIHELFEDQFRSDLITSRAKVAAVSRADHVICISESTRQDLIRLLGVPRSKTSVIYLGYSLIGCDANKPATSLSNGRPYLLYVGNRGGYKNFSNFCRAFASSIALKNVFDIVAFGGASFDSSEQALLSELNLTGQLHHAVGGDALLVSHYRGAALFVFPSLYEGFGLPPLEAMSFNCPVACSNTSSVSEIVGEAGIYFNPHSADSMRDAMECAMNSKELCAQLIDKGKERLKMFSWDRCVSETADVYQSVVSGFL